MKIRQIILQSSGYVVCRSKFYTVHDIIPETSRFVFSTGINMLSGEIDSGAWAASYMLSMYNCKSEDFILFEKPTIFVDSSQKNIQDIMRYSCYMDESYPLFSSEDTVENLIINGLSKSGMHYTPEHLKNLFCISNDRFTRSLSKTGNERTKAMAAVGIAYNKQVFCFPWLSRKRFSYYNNNITHVLEKLNALERIVILPVADNISFAEQTKL